jgi:membrane-associated phospholipid phosphatase
MAVRPGRHWACAIALASIVACAATPASAAAAGNYKKGLQNAGEIAAIALPVAAGTVSLFKGDWNGMVQLGAVTVLSVGTAYGLKHLVREQRPDHTDFQSLPSEQSALAFGSAAYMWDRYGWEYGLPAYAAAGFVGFARVDTRRHHWWDVAASAGFAWIYSRLITTRYRPPSNFYTGVYVTPHAAFVSMAYKF